MSKRQRDSSTVVVHLNDDGSAVVDYFGKMYYWTIPDHIDLQKATDTSRYEITIIHNPEHRAMIDIVNIRTGEPYLRQEINPLAYKDVAEWVVDE
jgi:hypothetical protein